MSGAAGLAAAKRRRAVTAPSYPKSNQNRTTPPPTVPSESNKSVEPIVTETKLTPLQVLNQHDTRIKELEDKSTDSTIVEELTKEINELKQTILKMQTFAIEQSLEITKLKNTTTTENEA